MNTESWKYATAAQHNLYRFVKTLLVGVQTITPLYYEGATAGSEFLTYDAKKIYICLEATFGFLGSASATAGQVITYNVANAGMNTMQNDIAFYNPTTLSYNYYPQDIINYNFWFSRVAVTLYSSLKFNGYKITIP
jgi:hypothetical protein